MAGSATAPPVAPARAPMAPEKLCTAVALHQRPTPKATCYPNTADSTHGSGTPGSQEFLRFGVPVMPWRHTNCLRCLLRCSSSCSPNRASSKDALPVYSSILFTRNRAAALCLRSLLKESQQTKDWPTTADLRSVDSPVPLRTKKTWKIQVDCSSC